jgi:uncharacterized membrane protein
VTNQDSQEVRSIRGSVGMRHLIVRPQLRHGGLALQRTAADKLKRSPISSFVGNGRADMLTICNQANEPAYVCIGTFNEDACNSVDPEAPWMISGWYIIEPGTCGNVFDGNLAEVVPVFLYYAVSESGPWPGSIAIPVPLEPFERCFGTTAPDDISVNFASQNVGNSEDFVLNLVE